MAQYRLSVSVIGRSAGRSATGAAAYRAGIKMIDERTGLKHDYTRKEGVIHTEIMTPDNAPDWMQDRVTLWNAIEAIENRKDAQLAREIQLSLPHELKPEQRLNLVRRFVAEQCVSRGMVADIAMHEPNKHEMADERNHHAHIMLTTRELLGEGFGKKAREWNDKAVIEEWRQSWAELQNREFERLGLETRVDHRSLADQGVLRQPTKHLGPIATEIERSGRQSHAGNDNRKVAARNGLYGDLDRAGNVIDAKVQFEKRKFEAWKGAKREALQIDEQKHMAQFQVGLAGRMLELDKQLEAEFSQAKTGLSQAQEQVSSRLQVRGWRKFVRDITRTTKRDKDELAGLEIEAAKVRQSEDLKRTQSNAAEQARRANIEAQAVRRAENLEKGIAKAEKRRDGDKWKPLPSPDHKRAAERLAPPLAPDFAEAHGPLPKKTKKREESGDSGGGPKSEIDRIAEVLRQKRERNRDGPDRPKGKGRSR